MIDVLSNVAGYLMWVCGLAMLLAFYRVMRGPTLPDRVVALDLLATAIVGLLGLAALRSGLTVLLDVAVLLALITFVGTVAWARYLETGGRDA